MCKKKGFSITNLSFYGIFPKCLSLAYRPSLTFEAKQKRINSIFLMIKLSYCSQYSYIVCAIYISREKKCLIFSSALSLKPNATFILLVLFYYFSIWDFSLKNWNFFLSGNIFSFVLFQQLNQFVSMFWIALDLVHIREIYYVHFPTIKNFPH